jgi:hypothetical protein
MAQINDGTVGWTVNRILVANEPHLYQILREAGRKGGPRPNMVIGDMSKKMM